VEKVKLLVITSTFPRWQGDTLPSFVYDLSIRMGDQFDVHVLAPYSSGSKKYEKIKNINVHRFNYWPFKNKLADGAILPNLNKNKWMYFQVPFFILFQFLSMCRIINKYKIKIIHAHWILPQGFLAVFYKTFKKSKKVLITVHGADLYGMRLFRFLKKWTIRRCSQLTVVSHALKEEVKKLDVTVPVDVIPMGVDTQKFHPKYRNLTLREKYNINGPFLIFVGRLSEKKGIKYLIEAMPGVLKRFAQAKLLIIGDGELRDELTQSASDHIIFAGAMPQSQLPGFYATADIFIGPSIQTKDGDTEGFGLVFAEAVSSGCTVIASNLPAIRDVVIEGKTGYFCEQKNVAQIEKKIVEVLSSKDKRINGRQWIVDHFDWEMIKNKYLKVLIDQSSSFFEKK